MCQPGWEGCLGKNGYMYLCGWVPSLFTWNYHNIVNWLFCWSVAQSCPTLCDPMDCSTLGLPVPHHLPKFAQVHVHCISDAIQPSHPLMSSSPSALNFSHHQGLFQWVSCSHQMAKILEFRLQCQSSGLISLKIDWFVSLLSKGLSRVFSSTTVQRHQFFVTLPSFQSSSHSYKWPLGRP